MDHRAQHPPLLLSQGKGDCDFSFSHQVLIFLDPIPRGVRDKREIYINMIIAAQMKIVLFVCVCVWGANTQNDGKYLS